MTPAVIMVTAYGREEALSDAEQQRVALKSVLTKPVTPSTLLEAIGEVLGKGVITENRVADKANTYEESMSRLKGARVLLVEDNEMNQELALELLAQAGMEVVVANNGQEAVDVLAVDANFDGVLMDCQMPVMDGYTATRMIRSMEKVNAIPIIAMTANAMTGDKEKVLEAGMLDHIAKPLNVGEMFNTIARWVTPAKGNVGADETATAVRHGMPDAQIQRVAPASAMSSSAESPPTSVGDLPALPGIDVKAGLATTMNKMSLYTRMLIKFRDSQGDFANLFAAARKDDDPEAATRAAHTLKGTAGNIGAKSVQAAAAALEHACKEGKSSIEIDGLLETTLSELRAILPGLAQVGAATAANVSAGLAPEALPMASETFSAIIGQLRRLLEESDSEAGDILGNLLESLSGHPLARALHPVAIAIENFDFDRALELLKEIATP
jgi:CheY-like chemotaxis protein/HPt (histidine-containing phosphotransfer) domain-containing protein